jgi:hypothetical protein
MPRKASVSKNVRFGSRPEAWRSLLAPTRHLYGFRIPVRKSIIPRTSLARHHPKDEKTFTFRPTHLRPKGKAKRPTPAVGSVARPETTRIPERNPESQLSVAARLNAARKNRPHPAGAARTAQKAPARSNKTGRALSLVRCDYEASAARPALSAAAVSTTRSAWAAAAARVVSSMSEPFQCETP